MPPPDRRRDPLDPALEASKPSANADASISAESNSAEDAREFASSTTLPWLHASRDASRRARESARYLDSKDGQIYSVLHTPIEERRGAVLMCGPFGAERERAYLNHVKWARTLAENGFETMRFDYSGTGESIGRFEDMTISRWREDAHFCATRLAELTQGAPLVLHGVRIGALIAAELFAAGIGAGLLLWAPPISAQAQLRDTLRHNLVTQSLAHRGAPWKTREQQIASLEAGVLVNVDGYFWSRALWQDARQHALVLPPANEPRPSLVLQPGNAIAAQGASDGSLPIAVDADTFWASNSQSLVPHAAGFFRASLNWLDERGPLQARAA